MSELKWEEPPVPARSKGKYDPIWAALRERPNTWALITEEGPLGMAGAIRQGNYRGMSQGEFEARYVRVPDSFNVKVYARYVGL